MTDGVIMDNKSEKLKNTALLMNAVRNLFMKL